MCTQEGTKNYKSVLYRSSDAITKNSSPNLLYRSISPPVLLGWFLLSICNPQQQLRPSTHVPPIGRVHRSQTTVLCNTLHGMTTDPNKHGAVLQSNFGRPGFNRHRSRCWRGRFEKDKNMGHVGEPYRIKSIVQQSHHLRAADA